MGRDKKDFILAFLASNLSLAAAMVYALASTRLSITYLDKSGFGLVNFVAQLVAYLGILDLGMTTAFTRILMDYRNEGEESYARALATARRIFIVLGILALLAATALAAVGSQIFTIDEHLQTPFRWIMLGQGVALFVTFTVKPKGVSLVVNHRQHFLGWIGAVGLLVNAAVMSVAFLCGAGIYSVFYGSIAMAATQVTTTWVLARPFYRLPEQGMIFDRKVFRNIADFAKDSILWQLGGSFLYLFPTLLVTFFFGLILTADLSGGMKMALLAISVATRLPDMAVAPLSRQMAEGDTARTMANLVRVVEFTLAFGICCAIGLAGANGPFVEWWMKGEINWPDWANFSAAIWLVSVCMFRCFYSFAVVSKQMRIVRWAPLWNCLLLLVTFVALKDFCPPLVVVPVLAFANLTIGAVVTYRMTRHTALSLQDFFPIWRRQLPLGIATLALCSYLSRVLSSQITDPMHAFGLNFILGALICVALGPLLLRASARGQLFDLITARLSFFKRTL